MSDIVIGIDNGVSGGVCVLSGHHGLIVGCFPMPVQKVTSRTEVNVCDLVLMLDKVDHKWRGGVVFIEEPNNSRTPSTAYSVAASFHAVRGMLDIYDVATVRITPQRWQRAMLGKVPTGQTKPAALAKARMLWPDETWLASPRCKVPHDGMVDAALIAEYGRKSNAN